MFALMFFQVLCPVTARDAQTKPSSSLVPTRARATPQPTQIQRENLAAENTKVANPKRPRRLRIQTSLPRKTNAAPNRQTFTYLDLWRFSPCSGFCLYWRSWVPALICFSFVR